MLRSTLLISILLMLLTMPLISQDKTIVAAADPWPPFVDPENPQEGLSLEIIRAAYKTQGYNVEMKYVPWKRAMEGVKSGSFDILPNAWMTEERKEFMRYSKPYTTNKIKFIKLAEDPFEYNGISSLDGKKIGVIRGYGYGNEFMEADNFEKEVASDFISNIKKLVGNRFDLTLEDEIVARIKIAKYDQSILDKIEFTENPLSSEDLYITCGFKNPQNKQIISAFNKGLKIIKENGTYDKIMEKYGIR